MPFRRISQHLITIAAFVGLFVVLVLPNRLDWIAGVAFFVFPLELLIIGLLLLVPGKAGGAVRVLLALLLGLAMLLRGADLVVHEIFARRFNLVFDAHLLADANRLLSGTVGSLSSLIVGLLLVALVLLLCWLAFAMLGRIQRVLQGAPRLAGVALVVLAMSWGLLKVTDGSPRADSFTSYQLLAHSQDTIASLRDIRSFAETVGDDPMAERAPESLFTKLQGKDVFVVFLESYGRAVLERDPFAESVTARLENATERLKVAGFHSRSAFLTAPVVGGQSWRARATLLSGAWIPSETRHTSLILSDRMSLNRLFRNAGWRTVAAMPAITMAWPEGAFFGYDQIYHAHNFGYEGLPFNWVTMPDQYVFSAIEARERVGQDRPPLMAELALISSHAPWTPVAELVPWDQVGDGRIFNKQAQAGPTPEEVWSDVDRIRDFYLRSIDYVLETLVSYIEEYGDDNLVLLALGDHPAAPMVTGDVDDREVPVHLIARDPAVMEAIADWQWQEGMLPGAAAPVWRMDQVRDRLVNAFSDPQEKTE